MNGKKETNQQKWALVTGATSGIGRETAKLLYLAGWSVLAVGRRSEKLHQLKAEMNDPKVNVPSEPKLSSQFLVSELDVSKTDEIQKFVEQHQEILKNLWILVNNAGLAKGTETVQKAKSEDWNAMISTNITGLFEMTRSCVNFMTQNRGSTIVNLGSVAGRWVYPGGAVYCATKFAVRAFSEGLRMDLAGTGVRVCNLEPGMAETEFSEVRFNDKAKAKQVYQGMQPLTANDLAKTILWLVEQPLHVNVQELVVFPTDQAAVGQVHRRL